ncbi:PepSY domain-containing protein [Streptomyces sp. SID161]|uniref:PepSY domain-containing protein n=1 Tax=Streptomyces sp. SID161 TaxID=2690251 RepID=UPI00136D73AB|nr:PepSY domain-containing protein [Streptomyces sp. SID161]MYW44776.1 peptidase M4 [Streptomyces sp. SID161]
MVTKSDDFASQRTSRAVSRGTVLLTAAAAAGALLTGCGNDAGGDAAQTGAAEAARIAATSSSPSASPSGLTDDQTERKEVIPKAKTGWEQALRAAVAAVPKSELVSIKLKGPADRPRWKTEVATSDGAASTVRVDAVTGKAGKARAETDQDDDDKRDMADWLKKATVTPQQAAQTATDKTKGTVTAVELDDTDAGTPIWSVDVVSTDDWNKTTYDIDATDRKVLREHVDRD